MYLYLGTNPRALYLITSSHDERLGRPKRALVFRAGEGHSRAIVEFLQKDQVDIQNLVRMTTRVVKGCLGLISVENGVSLNRLSCKPGILGLSRFISYRCNKFDRSWKHSAIRDTS